MASEKLVGLNGSPALQSTPSFATVFERVVEAGVYKPEEKRKKLDRREVRRV